MKNGERWKKRTTREKISDGEVKKKNVVEKLRRKS